jgi:hypothetical protein
MSNEILPTQANVEYGGKLVTTATITTEVLCDADCSAVALVHLGKLDVATGKILTLTFCGHDYDRRGKALFEDGWTVVDDTRIEWR